MRKLQDRRSKRLTPSAHQCFRRSHVGSGKGHAFSDSCEAVSLDHAVCLLLTLASNEKHVVLDSRNSVALLASHLVHQSDVACAWATSKLQENLCDSRSAVKASTLCPLPQTCFQCNTPTMQLHVSPSTCRQSSAAIDSDHVADRQTGTASTSESPKYIDRNSSRGASDSKKTPS